LLALLREGRVPAPDGVDTTRRAVHEAFRSRGLAALLFFTRESLYDDLQAVRPDTEELGELVARHFDIG
jgi:hypothetical protein